jgi:Tfp pilus assembly protein PilN
MKPVNLLPEGQRPRGPGDSTGNGPKIAIGVLAVLLLMVAGYVFTANQVSSRETEIAETRAAADAAQARATALAPYSQLAAIKQTRTASVTELAGGRFDWERLMREIAMVLPSGTWLRTVTAGSGPQDGSDSGGPPEPGSEADTTPTVKLEGCSPSQPGVATLLVRLRKLNGVTDVELGESRREDSNGGSADSAGDSSSASSCGGGDFAFDVTVTFEPPVAVAVGVKVERVPAALGGGQ